MGSSFVVGDTEPEAIEIATFSFENFDISRSFLLGFGATSCILDTGSGLCRPIMYNEPVSECMTKSFYSVYPRLRSRTFMLRNALRQYSSLALFPYLQGCLISSKVRKRSHQARYSVEKDSTCLGSSHAHTPASSGKWGTGGGC